MLFPTALVLHHLQPWFRTSHSHGPAPPTALLPHHPPHWFRTTHPLVLHHPKSWFRTTHIPGSAPPPPWFCTTHCPGSAPPTALVPHHPQPWFRTTQSSGSVPTSALVPHHPYPWFCTTTTLVPHHPLPWFCTTHSPGSAPPTALVPHHPQPWFRTTHRTGSAPTPTWFYTTHSPGSAQPTAIDSPVSAGTSHSLQRSTNKQSSRAERQKAQWLYPDLSHVEVSARINTACAARAALGSGRKCATLYWYASIMSVSGRWGSWPTSRNPIRSIVNDQEPGSAFFTRGRKEGGGREREKGIEILN